MANSQGMTPEPPASIKVEVGGLEFSVIDAGAGPGVLLLHGFPDSSYVWRHQVAALTAAGFRVVAPDLRGFGESAKPEGVDAYRLGNVLDDLRGILKALGVPRVHVVGHDWGGAMAWMFATTRPEKVDRLVALSVGHPANFMSPGLRQLQRSWYMLLFQFQGVAEEAFQRHDWKLLRAMFADGDVDRYVADLSRPGALTAGLNWYRANMPPSLLMADPVPFPQIEAPTMGVWSDRDFALTEEQMVDSAKHVSGPWRYERLEGVGHTIQLQAPEKLNALLIDFLSNEAHPRDPAEVRGAIGKHSGGLTERLKSDRG
ncbi:MAG: alpha/beta fold hydrolase [Candidatus Dormibacteraeota bacterium]|nr:alpha/beta fold hydrolase [Candidatus Dormibacteraeota bacterium]